METKTQLSQITQWLDNQKQPMLSLLEELVNIDSGSFDHQGVDAVGARLERFFEEHNIEIIRYKQENGIHSFSACVPGTVKGTKGILLMGHRDTVFPHGESKRRPFTISGDRAYGPGVADMKAGLVMNAFVLAAYRQFGGLDCPLSALFTTDEEIGSPRSRAVIETAAANARAVFNAEPARPSGNVVTGRKGGTFLKICVSGKSAHSGSNFQDGVSAINELAHKITALENVTDIARGITVNIGIIKGGQSVNTVSALAEGYIDLRYKNKQGRDDALEQIERIAQKYTVVGTSATLSIEGEFDAFCPSEQSGKLFSIYQEAMAELGVSVEGEYSGGCSDAGITSQLGCPTVCAVGPVGGFVHTPDEYLDFHTMAPRAQGLAIAVSKAIATF